MEGSGQCESGRVQLRPATAGIISEDTEMDTQCTHTKSVPYLPFPDSNRQ